MTHRRPSTVFRTTLICLAGLGLGTSLAAAQDGRPAPLPADDVLVALAQPADGPADERPAAEDAGAPVEAGAADPAAPAPGVGDATANGTRRRNVQSDPVKLSFNDVSIDDTIRFIVETTGKVVIPVNPTQLKTRKITLINDEFIPRDMALDLLTEAFRLNGVAMVETEDIVIIDLITNIQSIATRRVLGADVDIMEMKDKGNFVIKIFKVLKADAASIAEKLDGEKPDFATISTDENSNRIVVSGTVGYCQHVANLIRELDVPPHVLVKTAVFKLKHANAADISQSIIDIFEEDENANRSGGRSNNNADRAARVRQAIERSRGDAAAGTEFTPGPKAALRVTSNGQQNSVTVQGDPAIVDQIRDLIDHYWDLPLREDSTRTYTLIYTDPIKVKDLLKALLEGGSSGSSAGARPRGGTTTGGPSDASAQVGGIFKIEAYPDSSRLVVISKSEENFAFLDSFIEALDQPLEVGLPTVIPLKHADAEELAGQLNALLSTGAQQTIDMRGRGLQGRTEGADVAGGRDAAAAGTISFPWQRGQPADDQTLPSIVDKARIVPIARQNALLVLSTPEIKGAIEQVIATLDRPGRQVMISAIIAEVQLNDAFEFGLRVSSGDLTFTNPDNALGGGGAVNLTSDNFLGLGNLFTTSVLDANFNINVLLQALDQESAVRVLQEPRVFTSDNQEARFFDGQRVRLSEGSTVTDGGTQNFNLVEQEVGITLAVRPRITLQHDVDLEINLALSSLSDIRINDQPVIDLRETTTQIVIKNKQTVVLSGILSETESIIKRKIPLLGDIPILGDLLFTSHDNQATRREIIAFITPVVIDNPEDNYDAVEPDIKRLRDLMAPLEKQRKGEVAQPEYMSERLDVMNEESRANAAAGRTPAPVGEDK